MLLRGFLRLILPGTTSPLSKTETRVRKSRRFVPNSNEDQVNLEHILPKRASAEDWGVQFDADERRDYVHRLGNMALLQKGPNGRIGNKAFSVKKPILKQSAFALTGESGR